MPCISRLDRKRIVNYVLESDIAFRVMAEEIAREYDCYFELIGDGAYRLVKKVKG